MSLTAAQRKAAERERRAAEGLRRIELYVYIEDNYAIRLYAAKLTKRRERMKRQAC